MEKEVTDLDLDALEATARAATPGPWVACDPQPFLPGAQIRLYGPGWSPIRIEDSSGRYVRPTADAQYIAAANPTTTLALIARIRDTEEAADGEAAAHNDTISAWREAVDKLRDAEATIDAVREVVEHALHPEQAPTRCGMCRIEGILTRHQDKRENGSE